MSRPKGTKAMTTVTLNNSIEMHILGFGVFKIPNAREC